MGETACPGAQPPPGQAGLVVVKRGGGVQALTCQPELRRAADASGRTSPSKAAGAPERNLENSPKVSRASPRSRCLPAAGAHG